MSNHGAVRRDIPRQISAEDVCDLLARYIAQKNLNAATPNEQQVAELTRWINMYFKNPWDKTSIARYRKADAIARKNRETLDEAATILQEDLNGLKALEGINAAAVRPRIAKLETAIAALGQPRGWFEQGFPRFATHGPDKKPWAMMAQKIVQETLGAIQAAQRAEVERRAADAEEAARQAAMPAGEDAANTASARALADARKRGMKNVQKTVGAPNGPVIRFTKQILELILPPGNIPSRATIFDAVTNVAKKECHNLEKGELSHQIPPCADSAVV